MKTTPSIIVNTFRLLVERDGRRFLRALDERCPERIVDAGNETDIRGVVVFVGNTV